MADRRTSPSPDLYEVLGVRPEANAAELSRAYRRRLRQLHPDMRQAGYGRAAGPDAEDRYGLDLARVLHAYQVLRDPQRRASYDVERAARSVRRSHPPRGAGSRSRAGAVARPAGRRRADSRVVIDLLGLVRVELDLDDRR